MSGSFIARALVVALFLMPADLRAQVAPTDLPTEMVEKLVRQVFAADPRVRGGAQEMLRERGNPDVVAVLIQALRYLPDGGTLNDTLTGASPGTDWHNWMLWQEGHPEIVPYVGFDAFKADVMAHIDSNFRLFLRAGVRHEICLEEIAWGGVAKDGIPALTNPTHIAAEAANYLTTDELVFGVARDGDVRAYPLRILDWHEMFNDVVGGVPVALAYCTLCASGILFETTVAGQPEPFVFGSSGFLYRSNKLMYDQQTHSLWNQFTGRPVVGPLTGSGIALKVRPVAITTWKKWRARHPKTRVLSLETGFPREYSLGRAYGKYFASPELMFPALVRDERFAAKSYVFALRLGGYQKAWPVSAFAGGQVINDRVGDLDVVLVGDAASRTVRAYDADDMDFTATEDGGIIASSKGDWSVEEAALVGAGGKRLRRLPGHIAYWFAWRGYNPNAAVFGD
jgi:hypothetical protein